MPGRGLGALHVISQLTLMKLPFSRDSLGPDLQMTLRFREVQLLAQNPAAELGGEPKSQQ